MCDCFHIAFPNWHAASSGAGPGRRLRGPEPGTEDNSICDEASQFTEGERPRPQGSSPVEDFPESDKYGDSDKECEAEHDPYQKSGKKPKKSGLGSIFDKRSTPKMSKLKEAPSPEAGVIVKTAKDGCAEGLVYSGGGKDGIFIKEVVPESPAFKNLHLKEGDQVLSATVYFDNIPYEDAVQILEHAQAYKVKLCLKRKPEITETEGAIDSDAIPEDEVHPPEMREPGKKRRGDARISWPKFPTLGRGKKSRFTRSHSSSEADEQRKLELSPTTSDTESPIKSQDALKGKKKHKIKLPGLKRGRISSSEDTDAQNIQTEEMISPECLESPLKETHDTEDELKKVDKSETETHKAELVCLDSTLKTTDITAVLMEQETPSTTASPDGKKKKKERSELKLKLLGRDKKHKAKSSPKRLKTLGASLDKTDDKENEKSVASSETKNVTTDADIPKMSSSKSSQMELRLPKVEIDISDVGIICKPTHDKKGKGTEEKQSKTGFKLPKVGLGDVPTEEIIKIDASVDELKIKEKDYSYDSLLKGTELPKREDIEIPGMEDVSKITKDFKKPRAPVATISEAGLQAETVQLSIDVNSVKEAVSKLPGYKLPKVDMSGVPIPEEITVIDANAQRISVKTPTKGKYESKSAFTEISKTTFKLPNVTADVRGGEIISETKVGVKKLELESNDVPISARAIISHTIEVEKVQKESITFSSESVETPKELDIKIKNPKVTLPDFSISKSDIKIPDFKMDLTKSSEKKDIKVQGERTIFLQEDKKLPDVKTSPIKGKFEIPSTDIDATLKVQSEGQKDVSVSLGGIETKSPEKQEKGGKFKMPNVGISMPRVKGGKADVTVAAPVSVPGVEVDKPKLEMKLQQTESEKDATFGIKLKSPEISLSKGDIDISLPVVKVGGVEPKITEPTSEMEAQVGKFKLPKLDLTMPQIKGPELDVSISKNDVTLPDVKAKVALPDAPAADVTFGDMKVDVKKAEFDVKVPSIEGDIEGKGGKFKMPKLGVKLPKVKGPEFDINLSKKDGDGTLPKGKIEVELPDTPDFSSPEKKIGKTQGEFDGQGGKFKMPKLGITMPKIKGPEIDLNHSKKDVEGTVPEVKADIKVPDLKPKEPSAGVDVYTPESGDVILKADVEMDAKGGKFKMPKFGISMPKVKGPEIDLHLSKKDKDVKPIDLKAEMKVPEVDITVGKVDIPEAKLKIAKPSVEIKPFEAKLDIKTPEVKSLEADAQLEGQSGKFKIPRFTVAIPNMKGPDVDSSSHKKDIDVALPEAKIEIDLPKAPKVEVDVKPPEYDADLHGQSGKFKMPKFGIKMPKGPEIDISLPKKEVKSPEIKADIKLPEVPKVDVCFGELDVKVPEAKFEVEKPDAPDLDVKPPSGKIKIKASDIDVSDSPSKFKMPSLGFSVPKKDVHVSIPEVKAEVTLPEVESKEISGRIDVKEPEVEVSARGSPLKFKMPSFKLPKFGGSIEEKDSEIKIEGEDVTVTVPQTNVDLPDIKAEIHLPETEVKAPLGEAVIDQPSGLEIDAKFKKPRFSLPRFSFSKQSVPAPEVDVSAPEVNIPHTEGEVKADIDVKAPDFETPADGQGSKFKLPKFGITMPKISAPEIDLSLSKKDVEVTLPEAKVEGQLPDVDVKAPSIEAPEIKVETKTKEGSPSKLKMPTFKLPKIGIAIPEAEIKVDGAEASVQQVEVDLPDVKAEVNLPKVEIKSPSGELEIEKPSGLEMDAKFKKPRFSLPRFSFSKQSVSAPEVDISAPEVNIPHTEGKMEVKGKIDVKAPEVEAEIDGQGSKFKLPKFGIAMPKISAPDVDLSLSKKDVEVTLPESKVEGKLPDVEVKAPSIEAEIKAPEIKVEAKTKDGSPSKLKMPTFKLPKFGASIPEAEIKVDGAEVSVPQVDIDLPDVKAEVNLPEVEIKAPSGELEIEQPSGLEFDAKFKKPRFSLPRFSFSKQSVSAPEVGISAPEVNIPQTEGKVEVKGEMDVKAPQVEAEIDGQGSKFKLPKFGIAMPKISAPDIDLSLSKKDVEVTLPEAKVEGKLPDVEVKAPSIEAEIKVPEVKVETKTKEGSPSKLKMPTFKFPKFGASIPEAEIKVDGAEVTVPQGKVEVKGTTDVKHPEFEAQIDGKESQFKLPKFGITMPKISAPDIDLSLSKKDVEVTLPEAKVEGKLPDVKVKAPSIEAEIKAPEIKVETKTKEGSPSKLKMPTFKLPKFGVSIPEAGIKVDGAEGTVPQVDVDLPDVKAEANLPEVEIKAPSGELEIEKPSGLEFDAKFKKPRFSLPRFSFSKQSVPAPDVDISAPEVTIPQTKGKMELKGEMDVKPPEFEAQIDGQESKFKLPKFGITMPKISAPDIDLSLSKKDVEVTLPEAKVDGKLPDVEVKSPSFEAEIKAPEVKVEAKTKEGSPSKLKMPSFKLPKFGASIPEAEIKVDGAEVSVPQVNVDLPDVKAEVNLPEVEIKAPSGELEIEKPSGLEMDAKFKKPRFSLPRFSFSKQSVSAPEVDISAPEVNIPQTEGKVEVKGEIDIKAPEVEAEIDGQGSKFKLPKFGITMPKISAPELDLSLSKKDVEVTLPEAKVEGQLPNVEVKVPSIEAEIKAPEVKVETKTKEGSPSKLKMPTFKLPKFGASIPEAEIKVDGAEVTVPQVDVDLPDIKAEINLPEVEIKAPSGEVVIEQPSGLEFDAKFKKPRFSLPRFSFSKQSVSAPDVDISAPEVNIPQTEGKVEVKGEMDIKPPEFEAQIDGQESKFKLPKFGITMPKISAPDIDLSLSKKDVEVTLPEAKVEGKLPDVEVKSPSFEAEIKAPEIKVETKTKEGSPSKLKMPTFKLPKFGASIPEAEIKIDGAEVTVPQINVDLPDVKAEVNLPEVEIKSPSGELEIEQPSGLEFDAKFKKPRFSLPRFSFSKQSVSAPDVDINAPEVNIPQTEGKVEVKGEIDVKAPEFEAQIDGQRSKFKLPKFGITMPKISAPDIDLSISKKDVEVTLPEAKVEGKLPDVEVKAPSIEAEIKAPEVKVETKTKEGSPSKLKMPAFKLPKFGASIPEAEIKVDGAEVTVPQVNVDLPDVKAEVNLPEVEIKAPSGELEIEQPSGLEFDAKFKKPRFSLPRFSFSKQSVPAPEVGISAPEVNIPHTEGKVEVKGEIDVKAPEVEAEIDGQGSKFKLPRFGIAMPKISAPDIDLSLSKKDVEVTLPEAKVEGKLPDVEVKAPSIEAEIKAPEVRVESKTKDGSPSKLKMPTFKFPKFGASIPEAEIKVDGAEVTVPQVDVDLPDIKAEVHLPEVEIKAPSGEVVIEQPSGLEMDAKFKKPRFSLPRFSFSKQSVPAPEVDIDAPEDNIEIKGEIDVKSPGLDANVDGQESKFKLPKFGITMPKISTPETDLSLSKKKVEATLSDGVDIKADIPEEILIVQVDSSSVDIKVSEPEVKRGKFKFPSLGFSTPGTDVTQKDVELPDVEIKNIQAKVDVKTTDMVESNLDESPSKFKMPSFKLPKFGATAEIDGATPEVDVNISKDAKYEKLEVKQSPDKTSLASAAEEQPTSEIDIKLKKPRFSLPKISFGKSSVDTEADVSLPEVDASLPAITLEIKQTDREQNIEDELDTQESKFKMPKFGISMPKVKGPEIDLSLSKKDANVNSPEARIGTILPEAEESEVSWEATQKESSWSFPRFSFSKPALNVTVDSEVEVKNDLKVESSPKHEVKKHVNEEDSPAAEPEMKAKFSLPRFSFSKASAKEPTIPENTIAVEVSLSEGEVKIKESKVALSDLKGNAKLSSDETKDLTVEVKTPDNDTKSKDIGGSPLKFKMPVFKMPKIGITTTVNEESSTTSKETEETLQITKEGDALVITAGSPTKGLKTEASIKGPSVEIKTDAPKASTPDLETPQGETLGSPSKFKLPSFKMPRLSFSKPKAEDEYNSADSKIEENLMESDLKESKSPKKALPSFGDILKNIDVEFDVPSPLEEDMGSPRDDPAAQKQQEPLKETKQEASKSPERTGWFKFPTFGLSSPTDGQFKEDKMASKSPVDLTGNEELSPTCSIQSSEAFADISSTMTSESVGFSLFSPTKVTVKYSDPDSAALIEEMHSKVVMSTTKTEVISVEPNLPEKVTILSSGLSSSSEDTVRLESEKIHVITSNIQVTPESQQAKMLTSFHLQSAEGASGLESWTLTDSRSSKGTFMESRVVRESSSESKEVVITKQITRVVTTTEPISDETATSIKQLKDSVHTEKMRFFDGAEK